MYAVPQARTAKKTTPIASPDRFRLGGLETKTCSGPRWTPSKSSFKEKAPYDRYVSSITIDRRASLFLEEFVPICEKRSDGATRAVKDAIPSIARTSFANDSRVEECLCVSD